MYVERGTVIVEIREREKTPKGHIETKDDQRHTSGTQHDYNEIFFFY